MTHAENLSDDVTNAKGLTMHVQIRKAVFPLSFSAALALGFISTANAVDADAARTLARQSNCFKCHAIDKKKEGPAWKDVAAKYKGKAGAEDRLIKHITTGEKAKFEDGHEEDHAIVKTKDQAQIKNLVDWILSL